MTTSDALSMDPAVMDAQAAEVRVPEAADPWLERRRLSFGASEALALMIAVGAEKPWPNTPTYITKRARSLFGIKAGLRVEPRAGQAAALGQAAERPLVERWNRTRPNGFPAVTHVDAMPREWLPLIDRECPRLSWTPDGWTQVLGATTPVEVKTDQRGHRTEPDRSWRWQCQAAMAVSGAASVLVLYGPEWASWRGPCDAYERPIVPWVVERDDEMIRRLREAAVVGWQRVEEMRRGREKEST